MFTMFLLILKWIKPPRSFYRNNWAMNSGKGQMCVKNYQIFKLYTTCPINNVCMLPYHHNYICHNVFLSSCHHRLYMECPTTCHLKNHKMHRISNTLCCSPILHSVYAMEYVRFNILTFKNNSTWYLWGRNSKNIQLLYILACNSANKPSFQNTT